MNTQKKIGPLLIMLAMSFAACAAPHNEISFDRDWRFAVGDTQNAETNSYDDAAWKPIDVPHDWAIAGPFERNAPAGGAGAFLPSGIAWYRKHFNMDAASKGRRVFIEFDGVMSKSGVWINGMHLGYRPDGYASFRYELTPFLRFGSGKQNENVLAVRADTEAQPASRWYAGGGIYRHVRLIETSDVHVEQWGTFITTPRVALERATVRVESTVVNQSTASRLVHIEVTLLDSQGRVVTEMQSAGKQLRQDASETLFVEADIVKPVLWDTARPALYRAVVRIVGDAGALYDEDRTAFGIREMKFDAATGFWLNGRNLKLKGVALHADAGPFGMAAPLSFWERRLKNLKTLGVNAIRTAHHPFSPEVIDLCDRMGLIVMDEAFDMWTVAKNPFDYHLYFTDWSSLDTRDFVRRDRNHPSVAIWSVGNEIHDTAYPLVAKSILERLQSLIHENDLSRPVTMALFRPNTTGDYRNGLADVLDVVGQNYRENELIAAHKERPSRKIIGTENTKNRESWLAVRDYPAYAGMFLWSGADYLGEADRLGWPAISNPSGLVDRIDRVKPIGLERASWWSETPVVYIARRITEQFDNSAMPTTTAVAMPAQQGPGAVRDWSPNTLGPHDEKVEVYSNAQEVELLLNGKSLGKKPRNKDDAARTWTVGYALGEISARAFDDGKLVATDSLRTAGKATKIRLTVEQESVGLRFDDIGFVKVEIVDAKGIVVPSANFELRVEVTGAGNLGAFDNGDINDHTAFTSNTRKAFEGNALVMVRANHKGRIAVAVSGAGLESARAAMDVR